MAQKRPIQVVVPCFNEADRLDPQAFAHFAQGSAFNFIFVDDGSTDGTARILEDLVASAPDLCRVIRQPENRGKGEAIRRGMTEALNDGASVVGFFDADRSTPLAELPDLAAALDADGIEAVLGSRIMILGRNIHRRIRRHAMGRVFATFAAATLRLPVYDTQCGAKLFKAGPALSAALAEPFLSRWVFDVELLGRLLTGRPDTAGIPPGSIVEVPLKNWRDVPGSKLRPWHVAVAAGELARIHRDLERRRAAVGL
jgi:glycosyltransferase involved in cell wall biosynthesis